MIDPESFFGLGIFGFDSGIISLSPLAAKLRLNPTTGSVGSLTNLAGADGSKILLRWPEAIRSRASEKRGATWPLQVAGVDEP